MMPRSAARIVQPRDFSTKYLAVLFAVFGGTIELAGGATALFYSVWDPDAVVLLWAGAVTVIGALVLYAIHLGSD